MLGDPKGYYARLEISPGASQEAIHAAYRRKARILHPDIPVTGDADAFVAMKQAYEVLSNPLDRAAYDRLAKAETPARFEFEDAEEIRPEAPPPMPPARFRQPRLSDLPGWLWVVLIGVGLLAGAEAVLHLRATPEPSPDHVEISAKAPFVAPTSPPVPEQPVELSGSPNAYVVPAGGAAVVWRRDPQHDGFLPLGRVPPFTAVQAVRVLRRHGMVEIRLHENRVGFIEAARLAPGNAETAHQAFCAYNAGTEPNNAEVLARNGSGPVGITLVNRSGQPAVVKLRTRQGLSAATVYVAPNSAAEVSGLPSEPLRPEYAIGELWSRTCHAFAAGMRAQRFSEFIDLSDLSSLSIPPDLFPGPSPVDISDQAFQHP